MRVCVDRIPQWALLDPAVLVYAVKILLRIDRGIICTTSFCVPKMLCFVGQKKEQEINGHLLPKVMNQKVCRRMHTVWLVLVNHARLMEGL